MVVDVSFEDDSSKGKKNSEKSAESKGSAQLAFIHKVLEWEPDFGFRSFQVQHRNASSEGHAQLLTP